MLPMLCSPRLVGTDSLHLHRGPVDKLKLIPQRQRHAKSLIPNYTGVKATCLGPHDSILCHTSLCTLLLAQFSETRTTFLKHILMDGASKAWSKHAKEHVWHRSNTFFV